MKNSDLLKEVVNNLEQDRESLRIKKLIVCVCQGVWENDTNKLSNLDFPTCIEELQAKNSTLEELKISLYNVVKTLNKPQQYAAIAKTIYSNVGRLYSNVPKSNQPQERSQLNSNPGNDPTAPVEYATQGSFNSQKHQSTSPNRRAYDKFDLRLEVMNYTNPLRAKILLFSTLNYPFDFSNQDWSSLKAQELDDLLKKLFRTCKTLTDLESQLYNTASILNDPDENTKAANAIIQSLKPFYVTVKADGKPGQAFVGNADEEMITRANNAEGLTLERVGGKNEDDDNTCQVL